MYLKQRGNILFLILLAVVLFAALSYAVIGSDRGGKDISNEKAAMIAAQIINAIGLQESELMRFMAGTGLSIHQIDFTGPHGTADGGGNSPNCTDTTCDFWHAAGGKVTPPILPQTASDPDATASHCISGGTYRPTVLNGAIRPYTPVVSVTGVGTTASDLVLYYACVAPKVCAEINIQEGLRQRSESPILGNPIGTYGSNYSDLAASTATALANTSADRTAGSDSRLMSRRLWCRESASDGGGGRLFAVIYTR